MLTSPSTEPSETNMMKCNTAALFQNSADDDRFYMSKISADGQTFVLAKLNICSVYSRCGDMFILSGGCR